MRTKHQPQPPNLSFWTALLIAISIPFFAHAQSVDSFNPAPNNGVYAMSLQPDGKILIGGTFTSIGGFSKSRISRLHSDGTIDTTFIASSSSSVTCIAVQPDGHILVGGNLGYIEDQWREGVVKINPTGSVITNFHASTANSTVNCVMVQPDGKILVGGAFSTLAGNNRSRLGRLNANGTIDFTFSGEADSTVYSLALQADGKILVGGSFTALAGQTCHRIGRLKANGTVDTTFSSSADNSIRCLAVQPDNKILLGGTFTSLAGVSCTRIGRLSSDGTYDSTFNSSASGTVYSIALQADGKIMVAGTFTNLAGQSCTNLGRLNSDGTFDETFNAGVVGSVFSILLQPDGKLLVGGVFTNFAGLNRLNLGRLNNPPVTESLSIDDSVIKWLRGGTAPEVWKTMFEISTNGANWFSLDGQRTAGGWEAIVPPLPVHSTIRARGYVHTGRYNGSGSIVETMIGLPVIERQPLSRTNNAGTSAMFSAAVTGPQPLSFQWLKNGVSIDNGPNISGAQTTTLVLSNAFGADAGFYSLVASNVSGVTTSAAATLKVIDPFLATQPVSQASDVGGTATFDLGIVASQPTIYTWYQDGVEMRQTASPQLVLTNVGRNEAARYFAVAANAFGTVTSTVVSLSVNLAVPDAFNPGAGLAPQGLAVQTDGRILIGYYQRMCRVNADGSVANSLTGYDAHIGYIAIQPDEKIISGGAALRRHHKDGTREAYSSFQGDCAAPYCIALQPDGKILVGGQFTNLCGESHNRLGRLTTNGVVDSTFVSGIPGPLSIPTFVNSLCLQPDGKLLVGGNFSNLMGQARINLGRLNADGSLDTGFNANADKSVLAFALQPNGKILVGGLFTNVAGHRRTLIARLNSNGTVDSQFHPELEFHNDTGQPPFVNSIALQADGKIIIGGMFKRVAGEVRNGLARLLNDGTLDLTFNPALGDWPSPPEVRGVALQNDGKILVAGYFTNFGGIYRNGLGRLHNTDSATQSLNCDRQTITWWRGGSSAEAWRTTFEVSTNGIDWTSLGVGQPISGGWRLSGLNLAPNAKIRARGFVTGAVNNSSSWFVESFYPPLNVSSSGSGFGFSSNGFGFYLNPGGISAGQEIVVEQSANLVNWTAIWTNVAGTNDVYFQDPNSTVFPKRFYRLRSP